MHTTSRLRLAALAAALLTSTSAAAQAPGVCDQILLQGIHDEYQITSISQFRSRVEDFLETYDSTKEYGSDSFGLSMDAIVKGIPFRGATDYSRQRSKEILQTSSGRTDVSISDDDLFHFLHRTVSPTVTSAWSQCVAQQSQAAMTLQLVGSDQDQEFIVMLDYRPTSTTAASAVRIDQVTVVGATPVDRIRFADGNTMGVFTGMTQKFRRTGCGAVSVVVNLAGHSPVRLQTAPVRLGLDGPPVQTTTWERADAQGNRYFKDFHFTHSGSPRTHARTENLGVANARIYNVDYQCVNGGCGWSYHPGGGYAKDVAIAGGGQTFTWRRLMQVAPTTINHRAFYEVAVTATTPPATAVCPYTSSGLLRPPAVPPAR